MDGWSRWNLFSGWPILKGYVSSGRVITSQFVPTFRNHGSHTLSIGIKEKLISCVFSRLAFFARLRVAGCVCVCGFHESQGCGDDMFFFSGRKQKGIVWVVGIFLAGFSKMVNSSVRIWFWTIFDWIHWHVNYMKPSVTKREWLEILRIH